MSARGGATRGGSLTERRRSWGGVASTGSRATIERIQVVANAEFRSVTKRIALSHSTGATTHSAATRAPWTGRGRRPYTLAPRSEDREVSGKAPWASPVCGWRRAAALRGSASSAARLRGRSAASSGACRRSPPAGCSPWTGGCTGTWPHITLGDAGTKKGASRSETGARRFEAPKQRRERETRAPMRALRTTYTRHGTPPTAHARKRAHKQTYTDVCRNATFSRHIKMYFYYRNKRNVLIFIWKKKV